MQAERRERERLGQTVRRPGSAALHCLVQEVAARHEHLQRAGYNRTYNRHNR